MIVVSNNQIILSTIVLIVLVPLVQWMLAIWIRARLEKSIQHEYDKKIEDYKFSQTKRQKAEIIAKLFARWIKYSGKEQNFLDKKGLLDYYEELNQMSLELSLWIQDKRILNDIMATFNQVKESKDVRSLTGQIRKIILEDNEDSFNPQNIILWPSIEVKDRLFGKD